MKLELCMIYKKLCKKKIFAAKPRVLSPESSLPAVICPKTERRHQRQAVKTHATVRPLQKHCNMYLYISDCRCGQIICYYLFIYYLFTYLFIIYLLI